MASSPAVTMALAIGVSSLVSVGSDRLRIPALLPLLGVGLLLGTSGAGVIDANSLGNLLSPIITLGIGLLVFEGALHLTGHELRRAPRAVGGLLTVGALLTWALAATAAHLILGWGMGASALLGAMLTVTGPTVVQPILRRIRLTPPLRTALGAEAVLIDPIGVLLTVVVLAMLKAAAVTPMSPTMLLDGARHMGFPVTVGTLVGLGVGTLGMLLSRLRRRAGLIPARELNILAVGNCMLAVGLGELVTPEAGLVAATVSAMCLASMRVVGVAELHAFKEQLAALTVGTLFVLLASRFDVRQLADTGMRDALFVGAIILVVRPIAAGAALVGSRLSGRERAFAALFAPRGVVALSVAAVAAQDLATFAPTVDPGAVGGSMVSLPTLVGDTGSLERVMFVVIIGTVLWASVTGPILARVLGVGGAVPSGVLLVGGHRLSIDCALVLRQLGVDVTLVDSRRDHVARAEVAGLHALRGDATDLRWLEDNVHCEDVGLLLSWTGNRDVDVTVARWGAERFGRERASLWATGRIPDHAPFAELGGGRLLDEVLDDVDRGRRTVAACDALEPGAVPFVVVREGRPTFLLPGTAPPEPAPGLTFVVLGRGAVTTDAPLVSDT